LTNGIKGDASSLFKPLTPAQEKVAALVADGSTMRQIAARLNISWHTVHAHIRAIADLLPIDGVPARMRVYLWTNGRLYPPTNEHPRV
jgi:DNA-binding NarL/FixJ family response regulator